MTTTLRPAAPESRTAEGRRRRGYEICVNSRPVGAVDLLGPAGGGGPAFGRIDRLYIHEGERRRGRGTVAALAAEEVLRRWGCTHVEASVPVAADEDAPGVHLLTALGYTERSRHRVKEVHSSPVLPAGTAARPLSAAEFPAWWEGSAATYVDGLLGRGMDRDQAVARSEATRLAQLPDGPATEGVALRVLTHDGADIGSLWLAFATLPRPGVNAWVFDVVVHPERRGEGHGRSLMLAAERECLAVGARLLGLNVFTDNTRASRLYTSLGYRTVERFHVKELR